MFQSWKAGGPLFGTDSVHYPDDIAARRLPTTSRFAACMCIRASGKKASRCLRATLQPATPERVAHGKALVTERGCASCHEINGIKKPTNFAPELTAVGSESLMKIVFAPGVARTLPDYLQAKIRQPHAFPSAK